METILLQINNEKAYKLIEDLEALDIVKVLKKESCEDSDSPSHIAKPSEYAGTISKETAELMMADIEKNRNEWERNF